MSAQTYELELAQLVESQKQIIAALESAAAAWKAAYEARGFLNYTWYTPPYLNAPTNGTGWTYTTTPNLPNSTQTFTGTPDTRGTPVFIGETSGGCCSPGTK